MDLTLRATVNEIELTVFVEDLAQILGVLYAGFSDYTSQVSSFVHVVDSVRISQTLSDQPLPHAQIFPAPLLSAKHKLLRSLITKTILPRIENRGDCLIMEQVVMWLLNQGHPISLPHLMLPHMKHLLPSPPYYPYGLWLTRIFRAYDVLTPSSKGVTCRDIMGDGMLSRMELCVMGGELLKKDFFGVSA